MASQPTVKEKTSQALRILQHLRGRQAMTAAAIKHELSVETNMISARCSDMELFGLLDVSEVKVMRGKRVETIKAYRLSQSALDLLLHNDPPRVMRAAVRVMVGLNEARARKFAAAKAEWRAIIAYQTQAAISEVFSERLD